MSLTDPIDDPELDTLTWHWKPARKLSHEELAVAQASMHKALAGLQKTIDDLATPHDARGK